MAIDSPVPGRRSRCAQRPSQPLRSAPVGRFRKASSSVTVAAPRHDAEGPGLIARAIAARPAPWSRAAQRRRPLVVARVAGRPRRRLQWPRRRREAQRRPDHARLPLSGLPASSARPQPQPKIKPGPGPAGSPWHCPSVAAAAMWRHCGLAQGRPRRAAGQAR
jgi:hypothetical protein